jgi:hypothetical protein
MTHVIDFSWFRPDPMAILDAGFVGVIGYLGTDQTGKLLEQDWLRAYLSTGLSATLVWELGNQRALDGYKAGVWDAQRAIHQADELGYEPGSCIYYVLEDPRPVAPSQRPDVIEYARGLRDAGGPYLVGGYGSKPVVMQAAERGFIDHQWFVGPWGDDFDGASIVQTARNDLPQIEGAPLNQYDEDLCLTDDWGQHGHQHVPRAVEDPDVAQFWLIKGDVSPGWYLTDWMYRRWVRSPEEARVLAFSIRAGGGRFSWDEASGGPNTVPQSVLDAIPVLPGSVQAPGRRFPR